MSSRLADRLRDVLRPSGAGSPAGAPAFEPARPSLLPPAVLSDAVAEALGGEWRETGGHRFLVVERKYAPGHRHGRVAVADGLPPSSGVWPTLSLLCGSNLWADATAAPARLLFVDLETTGLAGGAGTYAFLVGCGWFDGGTFRVRQYFLSAYSAERGLLEAVAEDAEAASGVVTYNGKCFDLPLIETRFLYHRLPPPFTELPHVDMLHPARRLWRHTGNDEVAAAQASCRLSVLETTLCGMVREGDVPGFEIPARYFNYVRTGDARPLAPVLEHNRLDLLSLAMLTSRAAQLLAEGACACSNGREALGLGRLYERGGMLGEARSAYARAAALDGTPPLPADTVVRAEALRAYAVLCRRQGCHADAAAAWRRILDLRRCPARLVREATEALAIHHEHRLRDAAAARRFAVESLRLESSASRQAALRHRLARLDRKLGGRPEPPPLFTSV